MPPKMSETTPLLWPQGTIVPGSSAFPQPGTYPANGGTAQTWMSPQAYAAYQRNLGHAGHAGHKRYEYDGNLGKDPHSQFCALTGCPPTNAPPDFRYRPNEKTLYGRVIYMAQEQNLTYNLTAGLTNFLLLLQIVLGAVLTGLGGTHIPRYWITLIGATNTVVAGVVAYLKSRGQPMRARMFRDDLERLVGEIENSEVMWLGIAKNVHGYDDIPAEVTVRSEVARLTRLLGKAIQANATNNPDLYTGGSDSSSSKITPTGTTPNVIAVPVDPAALKGDAPAAPGAKPGTSQDDDSPASGSGSKKKNEEDKKKKEEEEKKKKEEEEKKKKEEADKSKQTSSQAGQTGTSSKNEVSTSSSSDTKGKGVLDMSSISNSISNTAKDVSSAVTGGTKSSESKTESSKQTSSTKQSGGGSGNFGLEDP